MSTRDSKGNLRFIVVVVNYTRECSSSSPNNRVTERVATEPSPFGGCLGGAK